MPETVKDYSKKAAQSFIQTAVLIDDLIYRPDAFDTNAPKIIAPPTVRLPATSTANATNKDDVENADDPSKEDNVNDINEIVDSFARKQIVCSMYQPTKAPMERQLGVIIPLCAAADVVIIDWALFGDNGDRALKLIGMLIKQATQDVPEQLRLILVYTQEPNLLGVADTVFDAVNNEVGDGRELSRDENGLAFHADNSRVAVLGKPTTQRAGVNESELATIAIEEFAKLASGILQGATLLGLAEIRNNSRKILSRFNQQLDAAFLTHLAMSKPDEDALSHIVPLLVSEIESVLEDVLPKPLMSDNLLKDWCMNVWKPGDHLEELLGNTTLDERKKIAKDICTKGFKEAKRCNNKIPSLNNSKTFRKNCKIFLLSNESYANERFAHFMANRTFYGNRRKVLTLGSILHDKDQDQYLLCIQPVCDSVRLKEQRVFMFVKLHKTDSKVNDPISHVVVKPDESIVELFYRVSSYYCFSATFEPDESFMQIVAKDMDEEGFYFMDICGRKYYWVDQLRASHAQGAVERFASNLSRVGLTESEWLRLLAKR